MASKEAHEVYDRMRPIYRDGIVEALVRDVDEADSNTRDAYERLNRLKARRDSCHEDFMRRALAMLIEDAASTVKWRVKEAVLAREVLELGVQLAEDRRERREAERRKELGL